MPGPAQIVTVTEAKLHLNITATSDDTELQYFIDAATKRIEKADLAGPVVQRTVTDYLDGGSCAVLLTSAPVASITSVTEYTGNTGATLSAVTRGTGTGDGYLINTTTGLLTRLVSGYDYPFISGTQNVKVVYEAGRTAVPDDARLATLMLIQHLWSTSQRGSGGRRATAGGMDEMVISGAGYAVPNRVRELAEKTKGIEIGIG